MTDYAATFDTPPERDLTTVRGAAAWGLEGARTQRTWDEGRLVSWAEPEPASATFRHAALDCAGICASVLADDDGHGAFALKWAQAYRLLMGLTVRARVSRAGSAP